MEEAKQELKDVVEFLRDPERFKRLGGKMPTGELSRVLAATVVVLWRHKIAWVNSLHFAAVLVLSATKNDLDIFQLSARREHLTTKVHRSL